MLVDQDRATEDVATELQLVKSHASLLQAERLYLRYFESPDGELIERAIHLNPLHPSWYWSYMGMIEYFNGSPEAAVASMRKNTDPGGYELAWLAAAYSASGDRESARRTAAQALNMDSDASVTKFSQWDAYRDAAQSEQLRRHMVEAGIHE